MQPVWLGVIADNARLPGEGQLCRTQPVAVIGNFSCCRFSLSKGQPATVPWPHAGVSINKAGDGGEEEGYKCK